MKKERNNQDVLQLTEDDCSISLKLWVTVSYLIISLTQTNETISRLASYSIMPRERRNISFPVLVRNR